MAGAAPSDDAANSLDLVLRAQKGESEALDLLFRRYYERVRSIVRPRLGRNLRQYLDSGDILQETFIGAVYAFSRFEMRDESSLIRWLVTIAENQIRAAADYHAAQKRDRSRERGLGRFRDEGSEVGDVEPVSRLPEPLEQVVRNEEAEALEGCLTEALREEYREVVILRDYAGASWEAIAALLGSSSADAVRMMYVRAVAQLSHLVGRRRDR